jgi:hypothetical protein
MKLRNRGTLVEIAGVGLILSGVAVMSTTQYFLAWLAVTSIATALVLGVIWAAQTVQKWVDEDSAD